MLTPNHAEGDQTGTGEAHHGGTSPRFKLLLQLRVTVPYSEINFVLFFLIHQYKKRSNKIDLRVQDPQPSWLKSYFGPSEHCGSISPRGSQVLRCSLCLHIFALASCLTPALLLHLAHRFPSHPCSSLVRFLVLFMALAPTSMVWAPAPEVPRMKARCPSFKICTLRNADRANSCSHDLYVPYGFTYHENTWGFCDQTCRDGTELQHPHCTSVQGRDICSLSIKCIRFCKILAFTRTS